MGGVPVGWVSGVCSKTQCEGDGGFVDWAAVIYWSYWTSVYVFFSNFVEEEEELVGRQKETFVGPECK